MSAYDPSEEGDSAGNLSPAGRTVGWKPGEANLQAL